MRKIVITIIVILSLSFIPNGNMATGGSNYTTTILDNIPDMTYNTDTSITARGNYSGGNLFLGKTTFIEVNNQYRIGPSFVPNAITANDFRFEFSPNDNIPIMGIRIPIINFQRDFRVKWISLVIYDGPTIIFDAQVDVSILEKSISEGYLLYLIGTAGVDLPSTELLLVQGKVYSFQLHTNIYTDITIPHSGSSSEVTLYNNTSILTGSSPVVLLSGRSLGDVTPSNGVSTISYTIPLGTNTIIAYYSDTSGLFAPSYDEIAVSSDGFNLLLQVADKITTTGEISSIGSILTQNGQLINDALIKYYISKGVTREYIGSSVTIAGIGTFDYMVDQSYGNYSLFADVIYSGEYASDWANFTVNKPSGLIDQILANGEYLKNGYTEIAITGSIKSTAGAPLDNHNLMISYNGINQTVVSELGNFVYKFNSSLTPGIYSNYISVINMNENWNIPDKYADLIINKATLQINFNSITTKYLNQPINITGYVNDILGNDINTTLQIFEEVNGTFISQGYTNYNTGYYFELSPHQAGVYNYKIVSIENEYYQSGYKFITLTVGKSTIQLSRGILPDIEIIPYNQMGNLSIRVEKNGFGLTDIPVRYAINSYSSPGIFISFADKISDNNGWINFSYTPDMVTNIALTLKIFIDDPSFNTVIYYITLKTIPVLIVPNIQAMEGYVDATIEFNLPINDEFNMAIDNNTTLIIFADDPGLDVTVNTIDLSVINGKISFSFAFPTVGIHSINISSSEIFNPNYKSLSYSFQVNILKGQYVIQVKPSRVSQGDNLEIIGYINSNVKQNISGIDVSIYIYSTGWILLGSAFSDINGKIIINPYISYNPDIYSTKWVAQGNANYYGAELINEVKVENTKTEIKIISSDSYNYGSATPIIITLQIPGSNILANQSIVAEFATNIYNIITDNSGSLTIVLPAFIPPKDYELKVNFTGSGDLLPSYTSKIIRVVGTPTQISIIESYTSYYGTWTNMTVLVTDLNSTPIANVTVELKIDNLQFYMSTNNTGYAYFDIYLSVTIGTYDIYAKIYAILGWEESNTSILFTHEKRVFDFSLNIPNQIYFSSLLDILIHINSNIEINLSNIQVDLYYLSSDWNIIDTFYTNIIGDISEIDYNLLQNFPPNTYSMKFVIHDEKYKTLEYSFNLLINPIPLNIQLVNKVENVYGDSSSITISINDFYNNAININFTAMILDSEIIWQEYYISNDGIMTIVFSPPFAGYFDIHIVVDEINYEYTATVFQMNIPKTVSELRYNLYEYLGNGYINVSIYNENSVFIEKVNTLILKEYRDNIWINIDTISINGSGVFKININRNFTFKIVFVGSDDLEPSSIEGYIEIQNISTEKEIISSVYPKISYAMDISLADGYLISYEIIGYPDYSGTLIINSGKFSLNILFDELPGEYTLFLNFPSQAWYNDYNWSKTFILQKATPILTISEPVFSYYDNTEFEITIIVNNASFTGIYADLYLDDVIIDSSTISGSTFIFTILSGYDLGSHDLQIIVYQSLYTNELSVNMKALVLMKSDLSVYVPVGVYTDGTSTYIMLRDKSYSNPINNEMISLYIYNELNREYDLIITGYTNSSGELELIIPGDFVPGFYKLLIKFDNSDRYIGISKELTFRVIEERVVIRPVQNDMGLTHGNNITVLLEDESSYVFEGRIEWYISGTELSGKIDPNSIIMIPGDLIGEYSLIISYFDENSYYYADQIELIVGYQTINMVEIVLIDDAVGYGDNPQIQLMYNNQTLSNIIVQITFNNTSFTIKSDNKGIIELELGFIEKGDYQLEIKIFNSDIINNKIVKHLEFSIILGDEKFDIIISDNYYYGDEITIIINDTMNMNSIYSIELNNTALDYTYNNGTIIILSDLHVGKYNISILRINEKLNNYTKYVIFEIKIKALEIKFDIKNEGNTLIISIIIIDPITGKQIIKNIDLLFIIELNGDELDRQLNHWEEIPNYSYELLGNGTLTIKIKLSGNYSGEISESFDYQITDTFDNKLTNNFDLSKYTVFIVGGGVLIISVIKKKIK